MRVLFTLFTSGAVHFLAARLVLAIWPAARSRRPLVFAIAAALSVLVTMMRMLSVTVSASAYLDGTGFRPLFVLAMLELSIVALSLAPLGLFLLLSRSTARMLGVVSPPKDAAEGAARICRREAIERVAGVSIASASTLALGWGMARGRHGFELEEVVVRVPGWPRALDGYVIAQVSDIHVGAFVGDRELDEGFELVRRARPDLVVATGDLVDIDKDAIGPLLARLLGVGARDGAYAVLGNHDHYAGAAQVAAQINASKVRLLHNEGLRVRTDDGGGFALLGVDDLDGRRGQSAGHRGPDLGRAVAGLPPDLPRILLAHQPLFFKESQGRVALQLSGHTHGGQINPGFTPAKAVLSFVAGRYERAGSTLWVNRGFGVVGPPARIGAPPEVTKIVIVAA